MKFDSTKYPISWFLKIAQDGLLEIRRPYQRRPVWRAPQKCHLIESILKDFPIPEVYLHVETDEAGKTIYRVVDGQQRIRTILEFIGHESPREEEFTGFALDRLDDPNSPWRGMSFSDLEPDDRARFFGYFIAVRQLTDATDAEVREMFTRLNKYLTPLVDQELRNAIYTGPFITRATEVADDEYWASNGIVSPQLIRRMKDIEFVSELLIGCLHGPQAGNAATIDEYYARYEDCETEFPGEREAVKTFKRCLELIQDALPDIKDTRWKNRTDFYSLFVSLAHFLRARVRPDIEGLRAALNRFAADVDKALADEHARVSDRVSQYVKAHEKGSSDKSRRAARHEVILHLVKPYIQERVATASPSRARGGN